MLTSGSGFSRRRGFSLVEVLLVMVIFGILVSFSAPRISGMRSSNAVRSAKQTVSGLAQRIRSEARLRKGYGYLFVNSDSLWIRARTSNGTLTRISNPLRLGEEYGVEVTTYPVLDSVRYDVRGIGRTFHTTAGTPGSGERVKIYFTSGASRDSICISGLGLIAGCGL